MNIVIRPIILNYKGAGDTIECLHSLAEQRGDFSCEPIVLDNASNDGSVELIRSAFPSIELIESPTNTGFCRGNNIAIRKALTYGPSYIFIVNNDTTLEPGCLQSLLECIQSEPKAGVVGPAIYYYDDPERAWFTGSTLNVSTGESAHVYANLKQSKITGPFEVPYTTGCAMLISTDLLKISGLFDERFFCYWEDVDLCQRIKRLGYRCLLCPSAQLYHKVSSTSNKLPYSMDYYMYRNRMLFVEKHAALADRWALLKPEWLNLYRSIKHHKVYALPAKIEVKIFHTAVTDYTLRRFGKRTYNWE